MTKLMTIRDTARQFKDYGATVPWLKQMADEGRIPCLRIPGKTVKFNPDAVKNYIEAIAASPSPSAKHQATCEAVPPSMTLPVEPPKEKVRDIPLLDPQQELPPQLQDVPAQEYTGQDPFHAPQQQ